jgi:hypothetical protein
VATSGSRRKPPRGLAVVALVVALNVAVLAILVVMSVTNETPPAFTPTPLAPRPANGLLVGPELVTVDATVPDRWRFFSFDQGTIVAHPGPTGWDVAFRRFEVIVNGGEGFAGKGGVLDMGEIDFASVKTVPVAGYVANSVGSDTINGVVRKWYDYSFLSHVLSPKPRVYAVRTAAGRFAKLQFVGYYCPDAVPGCVTFRYVYQGDHGVDLVARSAAAPAP